MANQEGSKSQTLSLTPLQDHLRKAKFGQPTKLRNGITENARPGFEWEDLRLLLIQIKYYLVTLFYKKELCANE